MNAVNSYAKANHISRDEAFSQLMDKSLKGTATGEMYGGASMKGGFELFGNGGHIEGGVRGSISGSASSGSQDTVSESGRRTNANNHDTSSQAVKDFRESSDYFISKKTSDSGSITDNNSSTQVDQFAASLSSAKNSYDQYTTSRTRSHEYSEMASRTESLSGQMNENLTQQFASFVQQRSPQNAEVILTNTNSPEVASQREALAREFVKTQVEPKIDVAYKNAHGQLGQGMGSVSTGNSGDSVTADYVQNAGKINNMAHEAGIKSDVGGAVNTMISQGKQAHDKAQVDLHAQELDVQRQHSNLESDHKLEGNNVGNEYNRRRDEQKSLPGADTRDELLEKALDYQQKHKP